MVKLRERQEALHNLDLQSQFIAKRDIDYENQRVHVAQTLRKLYNTFESPAIVT